MVLSSCKGTIEPIAEGNAPSAGVEANVYLRSPEEAKQCLSGFLAENSALRTKSGRTRKIDRVIDPKSDSNLRSSSLLTEFADNFYVITFQNEGYAIVAKDKRSFPIFAILDDVYDSSNLSSAAMIGNIQNMVDGNTSEINRFNEALAKSKETTSLRGNNGNSWENSENAINEMLADNWKITRQTPIRLNTTWGQQISKQDFYINRWGVPYGKAYQSNSHAAIPMKASAKNAEAFGCTTVAYGQVMYALRSFPGFNTLRYTNGERVLWEKMNAKNSCDIIENQRFMGWFTANCDPTYYDAGTMIYNIKAARFLWSLVGEDITSRYDNCIVGEGDFDGYGWSEDKRVAEDFFAHPHAFVIMTASCGALNYLEYHTFVIDGMVELKKRIKSNGFLGLFKSWEDGVRHLYHVNAGWSGYSNGYYLYVQNVNNEFKYTGKNDAMDYRSKVAYLILWPKQED